MNSCPTNTSDFHHIQLRHSSPLFSMLDIDKEVS